ncbi:MAG: double-strand break repair helicase AddA [Candidatus Methylacidiphilales bacterium]
MNPPGVSPPLADAVDRDRFTTELDKNFCVSASAGAGKTTAIVRRIAALVRATEDGENDPVARLAVVTYTRAAAAELRMRARQELQRDSTTCLEQLARRLRRLNRAFFGTLHSFTLELLRRHGGGLGLPAEADLLEEAEVPMLWEQFLADETAVAGCLANPWYEASMRHATFAEVAEVAARLSPAEADELLQRGASAGGLPTPNFREVRDFQPAARGAANDQKNQARLIRFADGWEAGEPYLPLPKVDTGSARFKALAEDVLRPIRDYHGKCLGLAAAHLAKGFLDYRVARGRMTYEDMIYWGRRMVGDPVILEEMRDQGWRVLLDEAQDTEPDMFDLLLEISRPKGALVGAWPDQEGSPPPEPGRFCFVGDDQQTIYGDARNLAHYQKLVRAFTAENGGEALCFSVTMRLSQAGIEVVNQVFEKRAIHPGPEEAPESGNGDSFRRLDAKPDACPGKVTRLVLASWPETNGKRDEGQRRLEEEARQVARWLRKLGLSGLGVERWDQVAVLAPRNDWLDRIATAFEEVEVPTEKLSSRQPRRDLPGFSWPLAVLRVVLWPDDRFELIGVLREVFAISDRALALAYHAHPDCLRLDEEGPMTEVPEIDQALRQLRALRGWMVDPNEPVAPARALQRVREELGLEARLEAAKYSLTPLEWLATMAAAAEAEGTSLGAWLEELRTGADQPLPLAPSGQAVQLLTCHKAKGLEWEVVVVMGVGRKFSRRTQQYPRVERGPGGLQIILQKEDRVGEEETKAADQAENGRLLYVAMTRAKRHLILADPGEIYGKGYPFLPVKGEGTFASCLRKEAEAHPPKPEEDLSEVGGRSEPVPTLDPQPLVAPAPVQRVRPSSLGHTEAMEKDRAEPEFEQAVGGVDYGNWWHETMQYFPWKGGADVQTAYLEAVLGRAKQWGLASRAEEELGIWIRSDFWRPWTEPNRVVLTEVPFLDPASTEAWLDGVMDCVVTGPEPGQVLVVDWKTDRPAKGESEAALAARLKATYGLQLQAYQQALFRLEGINACELVLYSTPTGQWIKLGGGVASPYEGAEFA